MGAAGPNSDRDATRRVGDESRPAADPAKLERGTSVERYLVLDCVGQGGMGQVYSAYDPMLDRKVALKLVRPGPGSSASGSAHRAWLLREAQAMAKLSHANVVTVYDVGTLGDDVFIAMEFVEGETLKDWLEAEPRPLDSVVSAFVQAGRGLAAGHAAGIVHRDFKPANVLLGRDGSVRVMDFGIARAIKAKGGSGALLATDLAAPGAVIGTPGYMAPEQHEGANVDPRADQFSFCVALYEGIYGVRPSESDPRTVRIPPRLQRALARGLSVDPKDRFVSMDQLLGELGSDGRTRQRVLLGLGVGGIVVASVVGFQVGRQGEERCRGADAKLEGIWDQPRQETLARAFAGAEVSYAADTWQRIDGLVDAYVERWSEIHREACEATRVRGDRSEELFDLEMECLDERLGELRALLDTFSSPTHAVVEHALDGVYQLQDLKPCTDPRALRSRLRPPKDPKVGAAVAEQRARLEQVTALRRVGRFDEAAASIDDVVRASTELGYLPLQAEALYGLARVRKAAGDYDAAEEAAYAAVEMAELAEHESIKAPAWLDVLWIVGTEQGRVAEATRLLGMAEAAIRRAEAGPDLQIELLEIEAELARLSGDFEGSLEVNKRALAILQDTRPLSDPSLPSVHHGMAMAYHELHQLEEAETHYREGLRHMEALYGSEHPDIVSGLLSLGALLIVGEGKDEGREVLERGARIGESALGPDHPILAGVLTNLGVLAIDEERFDDARAFFERTLWIDETTLAESHQLHAKTNFNLGVSLSGLRRFGDALPHFERAVAIHLQLDYPDAVELARARTFVARAQLATGDREQALERLALAEQAVVDAKDHPMVALARFELASALEDFGGREADARALVEAARASLAALDAPRTDLVQHIDEWLEQHPAP